MSHLFSLNQILFLQYISDVNTCKAFAILVRGELKGFGPLNKAPLHETGILTTIGLGLN